MEIKNKTWIKAGHYPVKNVYGLKRENTQEFADQLMIMKRKIDKYHKKIKNKSILAKKQLNNFWLKDGKNMPAWFTEKLVLGWSKQQYQVFMAQVQQLSKLKTQNVFNNQKNAIQLLIINEYTEHKYKILNRIKKKVKDNPADIIDNSNIEELFNDVESNQCIIDEPNISNSLVGIARLKFISKKFIQHNQNIINLSKKDRKPIKLNISNEVNHIIDNNFNEKNKIKKIDELER